MKVVTFGELMIRLQPFNYERFVQANNLEFTFGGGEANVAVSLANYGMDAVYVTKLPAHAIGQAAMNSLRRYGVDTSKIVRGGDRVGIYFNEKGASQRGSVCIYDRATLPSRKLPPLTSIGIPSLRAWIGSTSPASPRPWARTLLRSAARPARLPRLTASRSAAT
jgi:Sugar kinases, ribokinase family